MSKPPPITIGGVTDVGRVRERNEDHIGTPELMKVPEDLRASKGELLAVADGMGGHVGGEVASKIAIETLYEVYHNDPSSDPATALKRAVQEANARVHAQGRAKPEWRGMGTTLVAAVILGERLVVANVGDSRAYLLRRGQFEQVSRDHSWVAEALAAGLIDEEQARESVHRNLITRALGQRPEVEVDIFRKRIGPGNAVLLCSDGLSGPVRDSEMAQIVGSKPPQQAAADLVALANRRGARDNVSAVVAEVQSQTSRLPLRPAWVAGLAAAALAFLLLCALVAQLQSRFGGGKSTPVPTPETSAIAAVPLFPKATATTPQEAVSPSAETTTTPTQTPWPTATSLPTELPTHTPTSLPTPSQTPTPSSTPTPSHTPVPTTTPIPTPTPTPPYSPSVRLPAREARQWQDLGFLPGPAASTAITTSVVSPVTPHYCVEGQVRGLELKKPWGSLFQASFNLETSDGRSYWITISRDDDRPPPMASLASGDERATACGLGSLEGGQFLGEVVALWPTENEASFWLEPSRDTLWLEGAWDELEPLLCLKELPVEVSERLESEEDRGLGPERVLVLARWVAGGIDCAPGFVPLPYIGADPAIFQQDDETYTYSHIWGAGEAEP